MLHRFACALLVILPLLSIPKVRADDFATARSARLAILVGPSTFTKTDPGVSARIDAITTTAQTYESNMETPSSTITELWSDLPLPTNDNTTYSSNMTATFGRLKAMALAYATYGSSLNGDSTLSTTILGGLDWMNTHVYNGSASKVGNWWDWEIGSPLALNDSMVLMYSQLTPAQITAWTTAINHWTPAPKYTGANLMWTSEIVSLAGVLSGTKAQVDAGVAKVPSVLTVVTSGDGFYADGSFIQHTSPGYAYTGGYGASLMEDLIDFTTVYAGTQWALPASTVAQEASLLMNSFAPFLYKGGLMDGVRGRTIARWNATGHLSGRGLVAAFLHAALNASTADASTLNGAAKYWIQQDTTFTNKTDGFDLRTVLQVNKVLSNTAIQPMAEPTGFHVYAGMDRIVHLRPGWGSGLSLWSSRHGDYESINSENLEGWYTGNGMLYIYDADQSQYEGNFWPTVNNYFQQGTTVLENTPQAAHALNGSSFVGGVPSWDGAFGLAVMRLQPTSGSLTGNKAWFFLDNQIMCLGSALASSSNTTVRTVVANRQLTAAGTNTSATPLGVSNSSPAKEPATWYTNGAPISWAWIDGNLAGSSYGLYFPTATRLDSMREARSHAWTEIDTYPTYANHTTAYPGNYYYSTINHGAGPTSASYAYAVLPTISQSDIASYASAPEATVVQNDANAQAVSDSKLGVNAAVFWQSATQTVGSGASAITSDSKAAVFVKQMNGNLEIAVTDPTQTNTGTVNITLGQSATSLIDSSPNVTVTSLSPIQLAISVSGLLGQPSLARFNVASAGLIAVDNAANTGGSTVSLTGTWTASIGTSGFYGSNYVQDGNTNKGGSTFTFTPKVSGAGNYDVQIWYTSASNRATNVPVTVNFAGGSQTFTVDQTSGGGGWVTLGAFPFSAGTAGTVVISNAGTSGYVVADAVRLVAR